MILRLTFEISVTIPSYISGNTFRGRSGILGMQFDDPRFYIRKCQLLHCSFQFVFISQYEINEFEKRQSEISFYSFSYVTF